MTQRIGLLTLPLSDNFGGLIQIVALYQYLSAQGHDVVFIDKQNHRTPAKAVMAHLLETLPGQNFRGIRQRAVAARRHEAFLRANMPNRTKTVRSKQQVEGEVARLGINCTIVGSDQVWRPEYQGDGSNLTYFLDFGPENMRRISYAASFGRDNWAYPEMQSNVAALVQKFDHVSVREQSGLAICRDTFHVETAELAIDPTLLVDRSFYERVASPQPRSAGVLTYVLDHEQRALEIAQLVSGKTGLSEISTMSPHSGELTLPEWIRSFMDAEFVITDSYHGMIFSIIFRKPFLVIGNSERGIDRFKTLLKKIGLEHRLIYPETPISEIDQKSLQIDYSKNSELIAEYRRSSSEFIKKSLHVAV